MKKAIKIAAVMDFSSQSARDFATGLFTYMRKSGGWRLTTLTSDKAISASSLDNMFKNGFTGIILLRDIPSACEKAVAQSPMKIVSATLGKSSLIHRKHDITYTLVDDEKIGMDAASRFMSLGKFRTYAFLSLGRVSWGLLREKGFRSALRSKGIKVAAFNSSACPEHGKPEKLVKKWIRSLPRPAALFAATDHYARLAADICTECGFSVPGDISIIGVNNDEFFCLSNSPRLSSICPDHIGLGEAAAREMKRLLSAKSPSPRRRVTLRGHIFFERESSRAKTTGYNLATDAINYIQNHSHLGIRPENVARHLGVSRRLLDMRFRQIDGRSLNEAILAEKLAHVRRMLIETDASVAEIAEACSFRHLSYLTRLFKAHYGMPPAAWRKVHCPGRGLPLSSPVQQERANGMHRYAQRY